MQTVYLRNDGEVLKLLDDESSWVREVTATEPLPTKAELVRGAYLRSVSRPPSDSEVAAGLEHLAQAKDLRSGLKDLLWALVNTKEFVLNH